MFERAIQPGIFQRDADVIGYRLQQLQIFAREIVSVSSSAQTDIGDNTILDAAGNEVVQIVYIGLEENVRAIGR